MATDSTKVTEQNTDSLRAEINSPSSHLLLAFLPLASNFGSRKTGERRNMLSAFSCAWTLLPISSIKDHGPTLQRKKLSLASPVREGMGSGAA